MGAFHICRECVWLVLINLLLGLGTLALIVTFAAEAIHEVRRHRRLEGHGGHLFAGRH